MIRQMSLALISFLVMGNASYASDEIHGNACGFYVVLGCGKDKTAIKEKMEFWGGPGAGGGAGMQVADTSEFPNFRDGFYCLIDGPYDSHMRASEVAWKEAVPDAYVKNGC